MAYLGETYPVDEEMMSEKPFEEAGKRRAMAAWGDELRSFLAAAPRRLLSGSWEDVYTTFEQVDYRNCTTYLGASDGPSLTPEGVVYYYGPPGASDDAALMKSAYFGYYYYPPYFE